MRTLRRWRRFSKVMRVTRYRDTFVHELEFGAEYLFVTDLHDRLESRENSAYVRAPSTIGDQITFKLINSSENVPEPFSLPRNVPVPVGRYGWTNVSAQFRSFDGRILALDADVTCCSFYDGRSIDTAVSLTYRPSPYFELVPSYRGTFIRLPAGKVDIHLISLDSVLNFTPDMNLALQVQYDNISQNFGLSLRFRWEYKPGNEIFFGVGQSAAIPGATFAPRTTQISLRLGQTFLF